MSDYESHLPDKRLHVIAGPWDTSGHVIGEPEMSVVGTDIYEVLAGGYFIVHHVDVTVGKQLSERLRSSASRMPRAAGTLHEASTVRATPR